MKGKSERDMKEERLSCIVPLQGVVPHALGLFAHD